MLIPAVGVIKTDLVIPRLVDNVPVPTLLLPEVRVQWNAVRLEHPESEKVTDIIYYCVILLHCE